MIAVAERQGGTGRRSRSRDFTLSLSLLLLHLHLLVHFILLHCIQSIPAVNRKEGKRWVMDRPEQKWWISPPPLRNDGVCRCLCIPHSRGLAFASDSCFFLIFGCDLKGDRFIPSRSGMDLDHARCSLTMRLDEAPKSGSLAFSTSPKVSSPCSIIPSAYLILLDN